ncbi:MAG: hypothetical protein IT376_00085 [Polyangiaceae bacterium]|nr:hypothetical protein [Polyangiaceae bacterium]
MDPDDLPPVAGGPDQPPTSEFEQAEAVATWAFGEEGAVISVAYNDRTQVLLDPKIVYPDGPNGQERIVKRGASLMGWSYSTDDGASFIYGGRVTPPPGWAVIWGDPALATLQYSPSTVYLANLAGSDTAFPASGEVVNEAPSLDGFCIARSTTAGASFASVHCFKKGICSNTGKSCRGRLNDCLVPGPVPELGECEGIFYDGTALAAHGDDLYFAAAAVWSHEIHVWRAREGRLEDLELLADYSPFDREGMTLHPRFRVARGKLYVLAMRDGYYLLASHCQLADGCATWSPPLRVSAELASRPPIWLEDDRRIRTANQFSFDVGPTEAGSDELRIVYTRLTAGGRYYLESARCDPDLPESQVQPGFAVCSNQNTFGGEDHAHGADEYNPNLKVASPGVWRLTYLSRALGTSQIEVKRANLVTLGIPPVDLLPAFQLAPPQVPCTYPMPNGHYWGDYNDLIQIAPGPAGPRFLAPFTINFDDGGACEFAGRWTADMHVGAAVFQ